MRFRTGLVAAALFAMLIAVVVYGAGPAQPGGALEEQWVSDTARDNQLNHHAVGTGPNGSVVVAPVAELSHSDVPITDTSCALVRLGPENGSVLWRDGVPPGNCDTHALTEPTIEDIDGDGGLEVVYASGEDALVVTEAQTGDEEFRVTLPSYGFSRPTVADVHSTPGTEIVASDMRGNVVVTDANGSVAWHTSLDDAFDSRVNVRNAPVVEDVDADGSTEVVVAARAGLAVLSASGEVARTDRNGATHLAVAQADDDPALELFTADGGTLRAVDGANGDLEWRQSFDEIARLRTVSDADGDGSIELYVGLTNGTVVAMDAETGTREWSTTISTDDGAVLTAPVLANVNGPDEPVVVVGSRDGVLAVIDASSGTVLAVYERRVPIRTFPTAADVDGDGDAEILVRYGDGRVIALEYDRRGGPSGPFTGLNSL